MMAATHITIPTFQLQMSLSSDWPPGSLLVNTGKHDKINADETSLITLACSGSPGKDQIPMQNFFCKTSAIIGLVCKPGGETTNATSSIVVVLCAEDRESAIR